MGGAAIPVAKEVMEKTLGEKFSGGGELGSKGFSLKPEHGLDALSESAVSNGLNPSQAMQAIGNVIKPQGALRENGPSDFGDFGASCIGAFEKMGKELLKLKPAPGGHNKDKDDNKASAGPSNTPSPQDGSNLLGEAGKLASEVGEKLIGAMKSPFSDIKKGPKPPGSF